MISLPAAAVIFARVNPDGTTAVDGPGRREVYAVLSVVDVHLNAPRFVVAQLTAFAK